MKLESDTLGVDRQGEAEETDLLLGMGLRRCNKQGNLRGRRVLPCIELHCPLPSRILKIHRDALKRSRPSKDGLNCTLLSQGCILEGTWGEGGYREQEPRASPPLPEVCPLHNLLQQWNSPFPLYSTLMVTPGILKINL